MTRRNCLTPLFQEMREHERLLAQAQLSPEEYRVWQIQRDEPYHLLSHKRWGTPLPPELALKRISITGTPKTQSSTPSGPVCLWNQQLEHEFEEQQQTVAALNAPLRESPPGDVLNSTEGWINFISADGEGKARSLLDAKCLSFQPKEYSNSNEIELYSVMPDLYKSDDLIIVEYSKWITARDHLRKFSESSDEDYLEQFNHVCKVLTGGPSESVYHFHVHRGLPKPKVLQNHENDSSPLAEPRKSKISTSMLLHLMEQKEKASLQTSTENNEVRSQPLTPALRAKEKMEDEKMRKKLPPEEFQQYLDDKAKRL